MEMQNYTELTDYLRAFNYRGVTGWSLISRHWSSIIIPQILISQLRHALIAQFWYLSYDGWSWIPILQLHLMYSGFLPQIQRFAAQHLSERCYGDWFQTIGGSLLLKCYHAPTATIGQRCLPSLPLTLRYSESYQIHFWREATYPSWEQVLLFLF